MLNRLLFLILIPIWSIGQNTIGLPQINNFNKDSYFAGLQNWDIKQDNNGIMYFANNEGLLTFDGKYWNLFPLPNKTIARSIEIGADNNIYIGGQDELGYFSPNPLGKLTYHSLIEYIPVKDRSFGDVWDISSIGKDIFFRTNSKIFLLNNLSITVFRPISEWHFMGKCNNTIYAQDNNNGLMIYKNNSWFKIESSNSIPKSDLVTGIFSLSGKEIFISTLKSGVFEIINNHLTKITSPTLDLIQSQRIYASIATGKDKIVLATSLGGVYVVDKSGKLVQHFSKKEGLQNNNVLSAFSDHQSNIWLGLDYGIDCIAFNSAIKYITPNDQNGSGYTSIIHNNKLFIGTSGGVFQTDLQNEKDLSFTKGFFSPVKNTTGQTWGLFEINEQLLLGHNEGAFIINNNEASPINTSNGFWNFASLTNVFPSATIIAGNYKGLKFFNFINNSFESGIDIKDFNETSRYLAIDIYDNIWVSHPYHGVYRIFKNTNNSYTSKLYDNKSGLPFTLNNHVFKIKNKVLIATEKGIYEYNNSKDLFEPEVNFKKLLGEQSLRYLKEDTQGNIWFVHEKSIGVIDYSTKEPKVIFIPELTNKLLSGFEFINPVNESNIFIGGEKGFIHLNYEKYKQNISAIPVRIRVVSINNNKDSVIFGGYFSNINNSAIQEKNKLIKINYNWKNIQFQYSVPSYGNVSNLLYSYKLEGLDKDWSEWSTKTEKNYTNLPPGTFTFLVKSKNSIGNESAICSYLFTINAPWYRTIWANIFYIMIILSIMGLIYFVQKKKYKNQLLKHNEEQVRLQYLHQLEIEKTSNELIALRNEKLERDVDFKNTELATNAMHLVQKSELLNKIKTELNHLAKTINNPDTALEIKKMIKVLGEDEKMDEDWEHFSQHFDKVHSDFGLVLKETHPDLSANDLKLCTYLRMNLSSKEIAQLLNITTRGVEISRYRLRKKLGIAKEINLFDYLINLKK
jgi:DNA-binding CsgD family transcriptional regulator